MKKGRKGKDSDGVWTREPAAETQKQIDVGLLVREKAMTKSQTEGYVLRPQTLEDAVMRAIKEKTRTKKDVVTELKTRLGKCSGKKETAKLKSVLDWAENTPVSKVA